MRLFHPLIFLFVLLPAAPLFSAAVVVDFYSTYVDPPGLLATNDPAAVSQATGPLAGSASLAGNAGSVIANFGALSGSSVVAAPGDATGLMQASASWDDTLTIAGFGSGKMTLYFALSGTLSAVDNGGQGIALSSYMINGTVGANSYSRGGSLHSNNGFVGSSLSAFTVENLNVTFGQTLDFDLSLDLSASYAGAALSGGGNASASNVQLMLTGIEVYDLSNVLLSNAFSSGSGTIYGAPEPARALLTVLGCGGLMARRRRSMFPH